MSKPQLPVFPKINLDALVTLQKANLEAVVQAQKILVDAVQTIAKLNYGLLEESMKNAQAFLKLDTKKQPEAYLADAKAVAEKVAAVAKQGFDLGVKAQNDATRVLVERATANIDELKALAA